MADTKTICIAENSGGKGGIAGGAGANGQASQQAAGHGDADYGYPVIECVTGMTADFEIQLTKDYSGEIPMDLSGIDRVEFVARPTMRRGDCREILVPCEFTTDGKVSLTLTPNEVDYNQGVWYAEFLCWEDPEVVDESSSDSSAQVPILRHDFRAYLCIRKGTRGSKPGPQTITPMDVRLALMDTSPEANTLLDDLEFSDMMIMNAVERAIDEWEEAPPVLQRHFDATNFPFREALIKGAVGYLLQSVMYRYMRNRMRYQASGVTLDKNDKGEVYLQLAQQAKSEWHNFILSGKTSMNMNECFGVTAMPWFDSYW